MKRSVDVMEILEAFDLTGSYRSAAALTGCDHKTVTATFSRSKVDASTAKVVAHICYSELIVVDDIGLLPAGEDEAEALYRLVDAAYEKRSLILTSNLHPGRFDTIFPEGLATAAVDRLLHHAHGVVTEGQSKRLTDALEGRGVRMLAANGPLG